MRTFIAIELEANLKKNLFDFQRKLRKLGPPTISWTRESGMHLTLKFLGEIDETESVRLKEPLAAVCAAAISFPISVRGTGSFPPHRPPRVLWVGVEGPPALADLQAGVEAAAEEIGVPREERPFHPHLTLGRVKAPGGLQALMADLDRARALEFGSMTVRSLTFFQSVLKPSGAEYHPLAVFNLP